MQHTDDPAKLSAALEQLEAEKRRRIDEKVEKGEVLCVPPIVVGLPDSIEAAKAAEVARLRKAGETREIVFGKPIYDADGREIDRLAVIVTGVPRTGRDRVPDDYLSQKPRATPYIPPAPETKPAPSEPVARAPESEPRRVWVTVEPPSEKSCGTIVEGTWTIADGVIRVRDMEGRLFTERLAPGDNAEHVARRLLREKHGKHTAFYAPIRYPTSYP